MSALVKFGNKLIIVNAEEIPQLLIKLYSISVSLPPLLTLL